MKTLLGNQTLRTAPYVKETQPPSDRVVSEWVRNTPELQTRLVLVEYIRRHSTVRRVLFNIADTIRNIGLIPNPNVAIQILDMYWRHAKNRLETFWKGRLSEDPHMDHLLWAELLGTIRNVFKNMRHSLGVETKFGPHDVRRYD